MKTTKKFETFDYHLFNTEKEANKHLNVLYSNLIMSLAHKLHQKELNNIAEIIDNNLQEFIKLNIIKKDLILENDDE